jgi:hypothetical protein
MTKSKKLPLLAFSPTRSQSTVLVMDSRRAQILGHVIEKNFKLMNSNNFVLFDKYCSIVDQLGSKDSSRDFQLNYVINYFFTYI